MTDNLDQEPFDQSLFQIREWKRWLLVKEKPLVRKGRISLKDGQTFPLRVICSLKSLERKINTVIYRKTRIMIKLSN